MRCNFCGFQNTDGRETCVKCNKPLNGGIASETKNETSLKNGERPTDRMSYEPYSSVHPSVHHQNFAKDELKKTVAEYQIKEEMNTCPKCGLPLDDNGACPRGCIEVSSSATSEDDINKKSSLKETERPIRKAVENEQSFTLVPISEITGQPEGKPIMYEGDAVTLNRDNTDPNNKTITSQEQAIIAYEDGKWTIKDRSEYKTTFVQTSRKIELQTGDLILLGNQLFRFDK